MLLRAAADARIPVISEIELAARFIGAPIVAITGTNGKSTVTVMLGGIFKAAGMKTFVGGNLGTPLLDAVGRDLDVAVVEVSSFQLEWVETFKPRVGIHLNLTDDHFDRYRDLEDYGRREGADVRESGSPMIGRFSIATTRASGGSPASRDRNVLSFGLDSATRPRNLARRQHADVRRRPPARADRSRADSSCRDAIISPTRWLRRRLRS